MCLPFLNLFVWYDALLRGWCVAYVGDASVINCNTYVNLKVVYIHLANLGFGDFSYNNDNLDNAEKLSLHLRFWISTFSHYKNMVLIYDA
jgi:hypothetical protein